MYAVITGASSGFGREFARSFARRGYDLCLAARRGERLAALKAELEGGFGIEVEVLAVDLADGAGARRLHSFTAGKTVDVLVNDAGTLAMGPYGEVELEAELRMLDLNVRAVHALTRLYLDDMVARGSGRVLNVASMSSWFPVPLQAAYGAGKAYVKSLSEALDYELKLAGSPCRVSVVTPGYLNTEIPGERYAMRDQGRPVDAFVEEVVARFLKGEEVIVVGRDRPVPVAARLLPRRLMAKLIHGSVASTFERKA